MYKSILALLGIVLFLGSCSSDKNTQRIIVASEQANCVGVGSQKCLLIKEDGQPDWEFWYSGIDGFNYERGYEYVLEIKKDTIPNPAADQSSIKYVLVKEISKTQKESEDLPII